MKSETSSNEHAATDGEATNEEEAPRDAPPPPNGEENNNQEPVAACICQSIFKGFEGAELQELVKTNKLKQLELTQKIRMTFNEEKNDDNGASQKEIPSTPKEEDDDQNDVGTNASQHESKEATDSTHLGYGGPYHYTTPPPNHHSFPPHHGYAYNNPPPFTHQNYPPPPSPPKANHVNKSNDKVSKCIIM